LQLATIGFPARVTHVFLQLLGWGLMAMTEVAPRARLGAGAVNPVPSNPTTAAARMRRHRKRRRDGLRCLTVELRETEIDMLVCRALLKPEMRHSKSAIINAHHEHLDQTLSVPR
jgi:hypothetical protein